MYSNTGIGEYPFISNETFYKLLSHKKEFYKSSFSKLQAYQSFVKNYMSPLTRYNSLLLFHPTGSGKTLSAISILENFNNTPISPIIFVKNKFIKANFINEIEKFGYNPQNYKFFTYSSVKKFQNFNNHFVVIDEVHNITGNEMYKEFLSKFQKSVKCKLLIMSATPVFNDVLEIFDILNLLHAVDKELPLLTKKKGILYKAINGSLVSEKIPYIKENFYKSLLPYIKGRISYIKRALNDSNFAKKEYVANKDIGSNLKDLYITQMSSIQTKTYELNKLKNPGTLYKNLSDISICVFPDGTYGTKAVKKYLLKSGDRSFLYRDNIEKYSPKLKVILDNIESGEGIVFIYSNYVSTGTKLISAFLKENGYSKYPKITTGKTFLDLSEYNFDEDLKDKEPTLMENLRKEMNKVGKKPVKKTSGLSALNSFENQDGSKIKVIIGTPMISEGVTFKNIRQIHILEPYWNYSRIEQIIGRGIRFKSHEILPIEKRNVKIFLHCSVTSMTGKKESIDYSKYLVMKAKKEAYSQLIKIIEDNNLNQVVAKIPQKFDESTYFLDIHDKEQYNLILCNLVSIFQTGVLHKKETLYKLLKQFSKENITYVIHIMIDNDYIFNNLSGKASRIIEMKDFYMVNPVTNDLQESYHSKL